MGPRVFLVGSAIAEKWPMAMERGRLLEIAASGSWRLVGSLTRISHQPSTARTEVQPWLRRAARFILNVFTNTPADESLALLATTELTTSRNDVGEKYGLVLPWKE